MTKEDTFLELKCFRFNKWLPTECRNERCRVQMLMKYQLRDREINDG